jgi:hypothetical protein
MVVFFVLLSFCTKEPDGPGKPAGLRNGYLLRRGASATPALKRHQTTNLDTGPEDGPHQGAGGQRPDCRYHPKTRYLFHFLAHHSNIIIMLDMKKENVVTILMEKVMFQNNEECQLILLR